MYTGGISSRRLSPLYLRCTMTKHSIMSMLAWDPRLSGTLDATKDFQFAHNVAQKMFAFAGKVSWRDGPPLRGVYALLRMGTFVAGVVESVQEAGKLEQAGRVVSQ